jgi:hypothetical protein
MDTLHSRVVHVRQLGKKRQMYNRDEYPDADPLAGNTWDEIQAMYPAELRDTRKLSSKEQRTAAKAMAETGLYTRAQVRARYSDVSEPQVSVYFREAPVSKDQAGLAKAMAETRKYTEDEIQARYPTATRNSIQTNIKKAAREWFLNGDGSALTDGGATLSVNLLAGPNRRVKDFDKEQMQFPLEYNFGNEGEEAQWRGYPNPEETPAGISVDRLRGLAYNRDNIDSLSEARRALEGYNLGSATSGEPRSDAQIDSVTKVLAELVELSGQENPEITPTLRELLRIPGVQDDVMSHLNVNARSTRGELAKAAREEKKLFDKFKAEVNVSSQEANTEENIRAFSGMLPAGMPSSTDRIAMQQQQLWQYAPPPIGENQQNPSMQQPLRAAGVRKPRVKTGAYAEIHDLQIQGYSDEQIIAGGKYDKEQVGAAKRAARRTETGTRREGKSASIGGQSRTTASALSGTSGDGNTSILSVESGSSAYDTQFDLAPGEQVPYHGQIAVREMEVSQDFRAHRYGYPPTQVPQSAFPGQSASNLEGADAPGMGATSYTAGFMSGPTHESSYNQPGYAPVAPPSQTFEFADTPQPMPAYASQGEFYNSAIGQVPPRGLPVPASMLQPPGSAYGYGPEEEYQETDEQGGGYGAMRISRREKGHFSPLQRGPESRQPLRRSPSSSLTGASTDLKWLRGSGQQGPSKSQSSEPRDRTA